jgi:hypothetical protein
MKQRKEKEKSHLLLFFSFFFFSLSLRNGKARLLQKVLACADLLMSEMREKAQALGEVSELEQVQSFLQGRASILAGIMESLSTASIVADAAYLQHLTRLLSGIVPSLVGTLRVVGIFKVNTHIHIRKTEMYPHRLNLFSLFAAGRM